MEHTNKTTWAVLLAVAALGGYGCAAEAHAEPSGSALRAAAGSGAALDRDDDVDERTDEASDNDNDVDERTDEANDVDNDVDERTEESTGTDDDFELAFDALPAAVLATANAELGAGTVIGVDRDVEASGVFFEIDYTLDGLAYELDIAEDGTLLHNRRD
jgi:hypothetical protein